MANKNPIYWRRWKIGQDFNTKKYQKRTFSYFDLLVFIKNVRSKFLFK